MGSLSKRVVRLTDDFRSVEAGEVCNRQQMVAGLDERLGEGAGSAAVLLLERVADKARARLARLVSAEHERAFERADLTRPRLERDGHTVAAYRNLQALRGALDVAHGPQVSASLGLVGTLPRAPWSVASLGSRLLDRYDKGGLPTSEQIVIDVGPVVEKLRGEIAALDAVLKDLVGEGCEADVRLADRNHALRDFVDAFTEYKGLSYALLMAAGLDELARRLRPKRRKRRARRDEQEPSEEPTGT